MSINLEKGSKINLRKIDKTLKNLNLCLGWDTRMDLDAFAILLDENDKIIKTVCYANKSFNGVSLSGDNLTGEGDGDDEQIKVDLSKVPANVEKVDFTVTIHEADTRNQNFGQVSNAYIRIFDEGNNKELIRYDLGEDFSVETAVVVGELYRHNGEWKFNAIGSGFQGGLAALGRNFGVNV